MREEFEILGAPAFEERGKVTEEYVRFFKSIWTEASPNFRGKYFNLANSPKFLPKPIQKPHPPIWVGGESPSAMRRTAALGDAWYPIGSNPTYPLRTLEQLQRAVQRLRGLASKAGRGEIGLSFVAPQFELSKKGSPRQGLFAGEGTKIAADIRDCAKIGFSYIGFDLVGTDVQDTLSNMDAFAKEVLPKVVTSGEPSTSISR